MNHAQNKHNTWYFNKLWLENAMYLYTGRWVSMCASESIWCCDGGSIDDAPLKAAILRETDKLLCEWIMKSNANLLAKRRVTEKCLKLKMIINGWVAVTHTHTPAPPIHILKMKTTTRKRQYIKSTLVKWANAHQLWSFRREQRKFTVVHVYLFERKSSSDRTHKNGEHLLKCVSGWAFSWERACKRPT